MKPPGPVLRAAEWTVQGVPTHGEVIGFLRRHHYAKGGPNTSTYRHGLYERGPSWPLLADVRGVALWIPPTRTAGESVAGEAWRGVLCLSRLACDPDVPTNGASFLMARSMAIIDRDRWPWLLTYADRARGHTGAIYRATNWTCLGDTNAGDVWITPEGQQVGRKRGGHTYITAEMESAGLVRQDQATKIKFVHHVG